MSNSTPHALSRYRPAILVVAGLAAAFAGYQLYSISQASSDAPLHRSNAVRRPNNRRRRRGTGSQMLARLQGIQSVGLGTYDFNGVSFSLNPAVLAAPDDLSRAIGEAQPGISAQQVEETMIDIYAVFCDRLLEYVSPNQAITQIEADLLATWAGDIIPDSSAIARALDRHAPARPRADAIISPDRNRAESPAPTELSWGSDGGSEGDNIDPDGQTLQRTLYHIAEDRARQEGVVHRGITCNGCDEKPIRGVRWHCANCADFDLCANCEATNSHIKTHIFYKIRVPAPYLSMPKQEPLYPGKPHAMPSSVDPMLKKHLSTWTRMEAEEIDALWDQFTCLAGTEWPDDPNRIGWALDRKAFNHTFVPRYNSFVAAPNLIYDRIFAYYDVDKNGLIGFEEWIRGLDGIHASSIPAKSRMIFRGYDVDGDGYISRKDVLRIFRAYYAIEKEATRNYVAEIAEEISVQHALDTINSSQPLGSAFPPHDLASYSSQNHHLQAKPTDDASHDLPVLQNNQEDEANRPDMLRDTRNLPHGALTESEQDRLVADRWARREFYIDEEEGLTSEAVGTHGHTNGHVDRQVDQLPGTTQGLIASWQGYEIPAPEQDLGREVMYQITQQAFNELLDPIFVEKENDSMDLAASRQEMRDCAEEVNDIAASFMKHGHNDSRVIYKVGMFCYTKWVVQMFCEKINDESSGRGLRAIFLDGDGNQIQRSEAHTKLMDLFAAADKEFIEKINVPTDLSIDDLTARNIWLCKSQLEEEAIAAIFDCAVHSGFLSATVDPQSQSKAAAETSPSQPHRDPTLPQFRPNSNKEVDDRRGLGEEFSSTDDGIESTEDSTFDMAECTTFEWVAGLGHVFVHPNGPFFVMTVSDGVAVHDMSVDIDPDQEPLIQRQQRSQSALQETDPQPTAESATADPRSDNNNNPPHPRSQSPDYRNKTNNPVMHLFYTLTTDGTTKLHCRSRLMDYSLRPGHPETDQYKLVLRYIRDLAMDKDSPLHMKMLATLLIVERNDKERGGGGLLNMEEFQEFMQDSKLRFLEAWMEWVSI